MRSVQHLCLSGCAYWRRALADRSICRVQVRGLVPGIGLAAYRVLEALGAREIACSLDDRHSALIDRRVRASSAAIFSSHWRVLMPSHPSTLTPSENTATKASASSTLSRSTRVSQVQSAPGNRRISIHRSLRQRPLDCFLNGRFTILIPSLEFVQDDAVLAEYVITRKAIDAEGIVQ